jgi:hypothetical protein
LKLSSAFQPVDRIGVGIGLAGITGINQIFE